MKSTKQQTKVDIKRRQFFTQKVAAAAAVAGSTVVAASYAGSQNAGDKKQPGSKQKQRGYQESEHVTTYYEVADF